MADIEIDLSEVLQPLSDVQRRLEQLELERATNFGDDAGGIREDVVAVRLTANLLPGQTATAVIVELVPGENGEPDCYKSCDNTEITVNDRRCLTFACAGEVIYVNPDSAGCEYDTLFEHQIRGIQGEVYADIDEFGTGQVTLQICIGYGGEDVTIEARNTFCVKLYAGEQVILAMEPEQEQCDPEEAECDPDCQPLTCEWKIIALDQKFHQGCGTAQTDSEGEPGEIIDVETSCGMISAKNCLGENFKIGDPVLYFLDTSEGCDGCEYVVWKGGGKDDLVAVRLTENLLPGQTATAAVVALVPGQNPGEPDCYKSCDGTVITVTVNDRRCLTFACAGEVIYVNRDPGCEPGTIPEYDTLFEHQTRGIRGELATDIDAFDTGPATLPICIGYGGGDVTIQARNTFCVKLYAGEQVILSMEPEQEQCDPEIIECDQDCQPLTCEWKIIAFEQKYHQGCGTAQTDGEGETGEIIDVQTECGVISAKNCLGEKFKIGDPVMFLLGTPYGCDGCEYVVWKGGKCHVCDKTFIHHETDVRCEYGKLNVYRRAVIQYLECDENDDYCLNGYFLGWQFDHQAGCCDCPSSSSGCVPCSNPATLTLTGQNELVCGPYSIPPMGLQIYIMDPLCCPGTCGTGSYTLRVTANCVGGAVGLEEWFVDVQAGCLHADGTTFDIFAFGACSIEKDCRVPCGECELDIALIQTHCIMTAKICTDIDGAAASPSCANSIDINWVCADASTGSTTLSIPSGIRICDDVIIAVTEDNDDIIVWQNELFLGRIACPVEGCHEFALMGGGTVKLGPDCEI